MGSDRSAPGRPGWAGSLLSGREAAARPRLLPLLLVLLGCLGRGAAAEDAEVNAEVRTLAQSLCHGLEDLGLGDLGWEGSHARSLKRGEEGRGDEPQSRSWGRGRKGTRQAAPPQLALDGAPLPKPWRA